jgi:hypothetical protein
MHGQKVVVEDGDKFMRYTSFIPEDREEDKEKDIPFSLIVWWHSKRIKFSTLYLYAFDLLSCPAMSTECERVFSGAKRTITPERNRLSESIIEACECLKAWWREGIVADASPGTKKRKVREMEHLEMKELPN